MQVVFHDFIEVLEFMMTGLVESATIADLLLTLPHGESFWPVAHFRVYEVIFLINAIILYSRLGTPGNVIAYILIHVFKGVCVGELLRLARDRLWFRFGTRARRYEAAVEYLGRIGSIFAVQFTLLIAHVALWLVNRGNNPGQLLASTTLSVTMIQSYVLSVCVQAGGVREERQDKNNQVVKATERIATVNFAFEEVLAMVMTALYAMVGVLAYFFAMEGGQDLVEDNENIGRYLYYSSQVAYILAAASVGLLLLRAEDRTTALKTAFRRSQAMMSGRTSACTWRIARRRRRSVTRRCRRCRDQREASGESERARARGGQGGSELQRDGTMGVVSVVGKLF